MRTFAYCRVSTGDQTADNQVNEIAGAGFNIPATRIVTEAISGKIEAAKRPQFAKLLDKLESGDSLVVTKLDRLGRTTTDVLATIDLLAKNGVKVVCLALGALDLTSPAGKMTLTVLAAVAEFERDLLVERTLAGLERAREEGKTLGRPVKAKPAEIAQWRKDNDKSISETADHFNVSKATVTNACKAHPK